jgi:hypothetical protein
MRKFYSIELDVPSAAGIKFTRAELPEGVRTPFVMIHYSRHGCREEEKDALRLDLDKQVFLDHLEHKEEDFQFQAAARNISRYLGSVLSSERKARHV